MMLKSTSNRALGQKNKQIFKKMFWKHGNNQNHKLCFEIKLSKFAVHLPNQNYGCFSLFQL